MSTEEKILLFSKGTENLQPTCRLTLTSTHIFLSNSHSPYEDQLTFDTDSTTCILNTGENIHVWRNHNDFVEGTYQHLPQDHPLIITIGESLLKPVGIVLLHLLWKDQNEDSTQITLPNVYYFQDSPMNWVAPTGFVDVFDDEEGMLVQNKRHYSAFSWDHGKHTLRISHNKGQLPDLQVNPGINQLISLLPVTSLRSPHLFDSFPHMFLF